MTSSPPSSEDTYSFASVSSVNSFMRHLNSSKRILVLCGAGLSAPSGIPTFKGSGALWRGHKAASLSTIDVFNANPGLVWKYFADRRRLALRAMPNKAHVALAECAKRKKGMRVLTQNIDGLSQKAKHPKDRLFELHGSLLDIKCSIAECDYYDKDNFTEPLCPALAADQDELSSFSSGCNPPAESSTIPSDVMNQMPSLSIDSKKENEGVKGQEKESKPPKKEKSPAKKPEHEPRPNPLQDIIDSLAPIITPELSREVIPISALPHCPKCSSLLRPAVVWFGESLDSTQFNSIMSWIDEEKTLDLMMVIGTQAEVFPAARFVQKAREKRARIAVVNLDEGHTGGWELRAKDWGFWGDVEGVLETVFEGIIENCR